jgi:hypothetical protein
MQQNTGLFSQHVSSIIMTIFWSTLVSTAYLIDKKDKFRI